MQDQMNPEIKFPPEYGDVTELNTCRLILDTVGKDTLAEIVANYVDLLGTSAAIYEVNGDYAYGISSSNYCTYLDRASRVLCSTDDDVETLRCGKWICHECCWNESALEAIKTLQPVDVECPGGLHLYAVPIVANGQAIGAMNMGYGSPPTDPEKLQKIAEQYQVDIDELTQLANAYVPRPVEIVKAAKSQLAISAKLIGYILERKEAEDLLKQSKKRLELVIKGSNDAPWDWDLITNELYYSPQWWAQLGYTQNALPADSALWDRLMHPDDGKHVSDVFPGALDNNTDSYQVEFRLQHKDGHYVPVLSRGTITRDQDGKPIRVTGTNMDLTERKEIEDKLLKSEERYRLLVENTRDVIYRMSLPDGKYEYISPAAVEIFGHSPQDFYDSPVLIKNIIHPDWHNYFEKQWSLLLSGEIPPFYEYPILDQFGETRWIHQRNVLIQSDSGKPIAIEGIVTDFTDRKKAEEALQKKERLQSKMVASIGDVIVIIDQDGINKYQSPNIEKWFGWKPEDVVGFGASENIHPEDKEAALKVLGTLMGESNATTTIECRYRCKDGSYKWIEFNGVNLLHDQDINGVLGNYRDISARRRLVDAMKESEERFRLMMRQSPSVIELYDTDGLQVEVNRAYEKLWGFPASHTVNKFNVLKSKEVEDSGLMEYVKRAYAGELVTVPVYKYDSRGETEAKGPGRVRWLSTTIYPLKNSAGDVQNIVITHEDVSESIYAEEEKNELETRLRQAQKLEA
nr:PAS domain S-box protein [Desulfobulbaceae bacterium]